MFYFDKNIPFLIANLCFFPLDFFPHLTHKHKTKVVAQYKIIDLCRPEINLISFT